MPRRRAVSFAGFISKLLPSHRPEQGRTLRDGNNSGDSAYLDVGIKPEELTEWNIAEDVSPRRRAELAVQADEGTPRSKSQEPMPGNAIITSRKDPGRQPRRPTLSASQTHALLKSKEKTRQERRDLKASGDFLPVTGYDPWTGEWNVLTPTETLSSDTTSPSMDNKMTKLAHDVREAQQAYETAKSRHKSATERAKLLKAEAKLARIEKMKGELKHRGGSLRWCRHGRNWSSAAEPRLSPIAQSLNSRKFLFFGD